MWNCSSYFSPWMLATSPMFPCNSRIVHHVLLPTQEEHRKHTDFWRSFSLSILSGIIASFHLSFLSSELLTSAGPLGSLGSPSLHLQYMNCLQDVRSTHLLCFPSSGGQSYRPFVQCLKTAVSCVLFSFLIVHNESEVFVAFNQACVLVKREKKE